MVECNECCHPEPTSAEWGMNQNGPRLIITQAPNWISRAQSTPRSTRRAKQSGGEAASLRKLRFLVLIGYIFVSATHLDPSYSNTQSSTWSVELRLG